MALYLIGDVQGCDSALQRLLEKIGFSASRDTLYFLGDLVPTAAHVRLAYIMSYDLFPLETLETRKRLYEQAIAGDWILGFVHDPVDFFGKIRQTGGRYEFVPI